MVQRDFGDLSSVTDDFGSDHQTRGSGHSDSSAPYGEVLSGSSLGLAVDDSSQGIVSTNSTQGTEHSMHHTDTTASMTSDESTLHG